MTLNTGVEGIGHLLSDRLLAIPDYQRAYSWGSEEVEDLWNDLEQAITDKVSEYFLGSVVSTKAESEDRHRVIDGQQRLATVSLLYAALRDHFAERNDERWRDIEGDMLGKKHMVTRVRQPRLVLNAEDNAVFAQLTLESPADRSVSPTQDSHRRLVHAFSYFKAKFSEMASGGGPDEWSEPLFRWYQFVFDRARVIDVSVADESRAFIIFETLNDRGLNLSTADLLKNHLFGQAGARVEEAKLQWARAMAPFSTTHGGDLSSDTFLRHYWASIKGVVRVKALYSQIKPDIVDGDSSVAFATELASSAPVWAAMFDRDADLWSKYSSGALAALDTLHNLKVEQCRPLLLAGLRKLDKVELEKLLSLVVGWSIRWFVVGGGGGGTVERLYATTARGVMEGQLTTTADIAARFSQVPNDTQFRESFKVLTVRRGWLARYYLTALEKAAHQDTEPELVPNQNVDEVNLEHVLPRSAKIDEWPSFDQEELQNMRLRMGNQALLRKSHNTAIGNRAFAVKQPILAQSALIWTSEIGEEDEWTPKKIENRQERMAEAAVDIWRRA